MLRQWYLIDDEGVHPLYTGGESKDFWQRFTGDDDETPWPEFSLVLLDASQTRVVEAMIATAREMGLEVEEVTAEPERWAEAVLVARSEVLTLVGEPDVDLDERVMGTIWSEELIAELRCDGAFVGYDPAAGSLFLTAYREGKPDYAWCDSLLPGPSYAMVFDEEGRCTDEDPRRFALRALGLPESSPLLDRYAFVISRLRQLGLERLSPELSELPIAAALAVKARRNDETDGS